MSKMSLMKTAATKGYDEATSPLDHKNLPSVRRYVLRHQMWRVSTARTARLYIATRLRTKVLA